MPLAIEQIAAAFRAIPYVLALLLVLIVGLIVTVYLVRVLAKYISPPKEIYVHEVYWDGKTEETLAHTFRERFSQWAALPAGPDQAQVLFLPDHLWRARQRLADLNVSIAGVKVGDVFGVMDKVLTPPYRLLSVVGETGGQAHSIVLRLQLRGAIQHEWRLIRPFDTADSANAKNVLIDAAVFRVLFDLRRESPGQASPFTNARSLEAFVRGAERLRFYQEGQKQTDLLAAIENLRILEQEMPDFEQGLDLLALALAEGRREVDAIRVYNRLLQTDTPLDAQVLAGLDVEQRARRYQLELNRSQSHFFTYTEEGVAASLKHLSALRRLVLDDLASGGPAAKRAPKLHSLAAYAAAQLADVTGHLVTFVRHQPIVSGWLIEAANDARAATSEPAISGNTLPIRGFVSAVTATHRMLLAEAEKAAKNATAYWNSEVPSARAEQRALHRLMKSAEGYTRYRAALLEATSRGQFRAECTSAIRDLETANAAQPRQYTVLQNLGAIYSDPAFSGARADLLTAADYFQQSLVLQPTDYWGHYKLAQIHGNLATRPAATADDLKSAREHADKALAFRGDDPDVLLVSARVAMLEWSSLAADARDMKRAQIEQLMHSARGGDPAEVRWAEAVWAVHQVRAFRSTQTKPAEKAIEFDRERRKSLAVLRDAKVSYAPDITWAGKDRSARVEAAEKEIAETTTATAALVTMIF